MIFSWLRRRRRRKLLAEPFPSDWVAVLEKQGFYRRLPAGDRAALLAIVRVLAAEKLWTGCGGLVMSDEIRVSISAHAARLIVKRPLDYYDGTDEILVYPGKFYDPRARGRCQQSQRLTPIYTTTRARARTMADFSPRKGRPSLARPTRRVR